VKRHAAGKGDFAAMASAHEVIKSPNKLKSKVKVDGPKAVDQKVLARAEALITDLAGDYLEWVEGDISKIQNACDSLVATPTSKEPLELIYQISHGIKGRGGSFGYQLMTVLGDKLCLYTEKLEHVGVLEIDVIRLHIQGMRLVISQRIDGDGGKVGAELLKGLSSVTTKSLH